MGYILFLTIAVLQHHNSERLEDPSIPFPHKFEFKRYVEKLQCSFITFSYITISLVFQCTVDSFTSFKLLNI